MKRKIFEYIKLIYFIFPISTICIFEHMVAVLRKSCQPVAIAEKGRRRRRPRWT